MKLSNNFIAVWPFVVFSLLILSTHSAHFKTADEIVSRFRIDSDDYSISTDDYKIVKGVELGTGNDVEAIIASKKFLDNQYANLEILGCRDEGILQKGFPHLIDYGMFDEKDGKAVLVITSLTSVEESIEESTELGWEYYRSGMVEWIGELSFSSECKIHHGNINRQSLRKLGGKAYLSGFELSVDTRKPKKTLKKRGTRLHRQFKKKPERNTDLISLGQTILAAISDTDIETVEKSLKENKISELFLYRNCSYKEYAVEAFQRYFGLLNKLNFDSEFHYKQLQNCFDKPEVVAEKKTSASNILKEYGNPHEEWRQINVGYTERETKVFEATHESGIKVAIKVASYLEDEYQNYKALGCVNNLKALDDGLPQIVEYGYFNELGEGKMALVMTYFGEDMLTAIDKYHITINDFCKLVDQLLDGLKNMHDKNRLHSDLKPFNFAFGHCNPDEDHPKVTKVAASYQYNGYIFDLETAKPYLDENLNHFSEGESVLCDSTWAYRSLRGLDDLRLSRKDDMESFGYALCHMFMNKQLKSEKQITDAKKAIQENPMVLADILASLKQHSEALYNFGVNSMICYFNLVKGMQFESDPEYDEFKLCFHRAAKPYLSERFW